MNEILLGCIADDFTGATDLASNLVREGMRVVQTIGIPSAPLAEEADAVVVALKTRTVPAGEAVAQSLAALQWLRQHGARQIYFKYCSTFDSTPAGNIGPVTEALMDALGCDFTIACPAFPENGRTVFQGHLFVGDVLLQDSGMRHHPLTPMTDSSLVRLLQAQARRKVGLVAEPVVRAGPGAITARMEALRSAGHGIAIVDALSDGDLRAIGAAARELPLVTAGSGVALGLPANFGIAPGGMAARLPAARGLRAIVSGSCSTATRSQVAQFLRHGGAALAVDPLRAAAGSDVVAEALDWALPRVRTGPVLVYATAEPQEVRRVQGMLGVGSAGQLVEDILARVAGGLVEAGVRQLIVAGGETSGACVQALGIRSMRIGPQAAPGVPWCSAQTSVCSAEAIHIALKSGNFGAPGFFVDAFDLLQ
jgi:uncharacterized protein YgbK (DUF1537 family)